MYSLRTARPARGTLRHFNLLYADGVRLARTHDAEEALEAFESDLHLNVAAEARGRVFVHAGVVGWKGRAIIMPGRSHAGKTTLVAALIRAGADYYSDEYAVLDRRGRVHPFARPLGIRQSETARQTRLTIESLNGTAGERPLAAGLVVLSEYRPGGRWRPRRLSQGRGLLALLSNTVSARIRPEAAFEALGEVTAHAYVLKSARGEASEAAEAILKMVS